MTEGTKQELAALEKLANPYRWRTGINTDGEAVIFGKHGQIEWHSFDNQTFAVYTCSRKTMKTLLSLPWITVHQHGDHELRVVFPRKRFPEMAAILKLKKKRPAPTHLQGFHYQAGVQSRNQDQISPCLAGS